MGRPLKIKYSGATAIGVQEMSDADISDLILPLVVANWSGLLEASGPSGSVVRSYGTTPPSYNFISRGVGYNTETDSIGTHPRTTSTTTTYTVVQNEFDPGLSATAGVRPIQQSLVGSEVKISSMSNQDIINDVMPVIVNSISTGGQGAYYLGLTSAGAPATGTWVAVSNLIDNYYNSSNVYQSIQYTLWLRTSGGSVGTIRPLTITNTGGGETRLTEMTNSEIEQLASFVGEYIRTTGLGKYQFATSAPGYGTWVSRGSFTDTVNNLANVPYTGYYTGQFTGTFTGNWTSTYNGYYTGNWTGVYTGSYTGVWSKEYTGYYQRTWTGYYQRTWTGYYQRTWAGYYQRQWTGVWGGNVGKSYTGNWAAGPVRFEYYTGSYVTTRSTVYTPNYQRDRVTFFGPQSYHLQLYYSGYLADGNYTGYYQRQSNPSAGVYYVSSWSRTSTIPVWFTSIGTVTYTGYYGGTGGAGTNWTRLYTGAINKSRSASFTSNIATAYTGLYTRNYTRDRFVNYTRDNYQNYTRDNYQNYTRDNYQNYTGVYTGNFTGVWNRQWTGYYPREYTGYYNREYVGYYNNSFSREFSGVYNGMTVQASTTTTTYYLWVRTA